MQPFFNTSTASTIRADAIQHSEVKVRSRSNVKQPKQVAGSELNRDKSNSVPFAMLGLKPNAEWSEVRKSYVRMTKLYHPDQYSTVTLPIEVLQYMSEMFSQSNTAYNLIKSTTAEKEPA